MSLALTKQIWAREDLGGTAKLVALALADLCVQNRPEPDCYQCWPSIDEIGRRCGIGQRYVYKILFELRECGDVMRIVQRGPKSSLYCLVPLAYAGECPPQLCAECTRAPEHAPCRPKPCTIVHKALHYSSQSPADSAGLLAQKTPPNLPQSKAYDEAAGAQSVNQSGTKQSFSARARDGPNECSNRKSTHENDVARNAQKQLRKRGHLAVPTGVYMPVAVRRLLEGTNGQIPPATRLAFEGRMWDCAAEYGIEPLQGALRKLALALPQNPAALARYFDAILEQYVKRWQAEQTAMREYEENGRHIQERQKILWDETPEQYAAIGERLRAMRRRLQCKSRRE